jgi:uncharacterized membrane protein
MKATTKFIGLFFVLTLSLAGCGGSSSSTPIVPLDPGPTPDPSPTLDPGPTLDLGGPEDGTGNPVAITFASAVDINDVNQVVGYVELEEGSPLIAAVWTVDFEGAPTASPVPLAGIATGQFSAAFAIDEPVNGDAIGNVVGQAATGNGIQQVAVIWKTGSSTPTELPRLNLNSSRNSAAFGVSPDGTKIVGLHEKNIGTNLNPNIVNRAVLWRADSVAPSGYAIVELPFYIDAPLGDNFVASDYGSGNAVNDAGWIAGELENRNGRLHAVVWVPDANGGYLAADVLDLRSGGEAGSAAYAINVSNEVVGERETTTGVYHPVLWADPGVADPVSLAATGGAVAINEGALIAGYSGTSPRATVWTGITATASLFATESQAYGVNNGSLVVGREGSKGFVRRLNN